MLEVKPEFYADLHRTLNVQTLQKETARNLLTLPVLKWGFMQATPFESLGVAEIRGTIFFNPRETQVGPGGQLKQKVNAGRTIRLLNFDAH
jgi:hypothetical protein